MLVWDDMMREASPEQVGEGVVVRVGVMTVRQVRARMLDTLVQPVVWSYGEQLALDPQVGISGVFIGSNRGLYKPQTLG